ncbi:MAG: helix-turn-helix transcriptional regulator [Actinomycetaceae bacterium]|nr:helix-turn-helix transcriptional regulator [Actinomycetaceae bacterium]
MDILEEFGLNPNDPYVQASKRMAHNRFVVANSLRAVRVANGISQQEAARRMGTDQAAISRMESGERDLRMSTLRRYADAIHAEVAINVSNTQLSVRSGMPIENVWEKDGSAYELQLQGA